MSSEEMSLMSHHSCSWHKVVQVRPCLQRPCTVAMVLRFSEGHQVKVKAKCAERLLKWTLNRKDLAKPVRAGHLAAVEWMKSVISKMMGAGNWGLFGETTVSRLP